METGLIEFRFGYSLRGNSKLHTEDNYGGAEEALTRAER